MKHPESILKDQKIYIPRRYRQGLFKEAGEIKINITFTPLICTELYKRWRSLEVDLFSKSKDYTQLNKEVKKDESKIEDLEKVAQELQALADEAEEVGFKLMLTAIESNDNPPEYAKREWILENFVQEDVGDFISSIMHMTAESKKK